MHSPSESAQIYHCSYEYQLIYPKALIFSPERYRMQNKHTNGRCAPDEIVTVLIIPSIGRDNRSLNLPTLRMLRYLSSNLQPVCLRVNEL